MGAISNLYGRFFARFYDKLLASTEDAMMRKTRAELLADASGRVLELGAGTGLNLEHYPGAVTELVLTEPERPMARQLRKKVEGATVPATVIEAPGEQLPFGDDEFDTVVSTLVLCTVADPDQTLAEVERVLKPGGKLLFAEHVRSESPRLAKWQDRMHGINKFIGHGCNCNRETGTTIGASPLSIDQIRSDKLAKAPPWVRPMIIGSAVKRA
jgi:ubiquinone/menaquinone biosynthesis C-methylase UbiE